MITTCKICLIGSWIEKCTGIWAKHRQMEPAYMVILVRVDELGSRACTALYNSVTLCTLSSLITLQYCEFIHWFIVSMMYTKTTIKNINAITQSTIEINSQVLHLYFPWWNIEYSAFFLNVYLPYAIDLIDIHKSCWHNFCKIIQISPQKIKNSILQHCF